MPATDKKTNQSLSVASSLPNGEAPRVGLPSDPDQVTGLSEQEVVEAIGCLLSMEDDRRPSRFAANIQPQISQLFAPPPANLAALYYVSYIFSGNWLHGGAIALRGPQAKESSAQGEYVTRQEAVSAAYEAYRKWFAEVKRVGFRKAREESLDPLSGTGLEWYGSAGPPPQSSSSHQ
ncbi:MAG: hypothetical protein ACLPY1_01675 [Terracidiphilus sp.]